MLKKICKEKNIVNQYYFRYQVLEGQTAFTCKHVLAAWLAVLDKEKIIYQKLTFSQFRGLLVYQVSYKQNVYSQ